MLSKARHVAAVGLAMMPIALAFVAAIIIYFARPARGDEDQHNHGSNGLPTWYDADCCHERDCIPVEDSTIQFGMTADGKPVVIYTEVAPDGDRTTFVYEKERWRSSKDERYHACRRGFSPLCVYIRPGA